MTQSRPVSASGRRYGLAVFIGRFSPPHLGHLAVIEQALRVAQNALIIIGSADAARRYDYVPFTARERETMIRLMLTPEQNQRVRFSYVEDQGNMPAWSALVRKAANAIEPDNTKITLIGHSKDNSSFYLKHFPGWNAQDVDNYMGLSARTYRNAYFAPKRVETVVLGETKDFVPDDIGTLPPGSKLVATFEPHVFDAADFSQACENTVHPEVIDWLIGFAKKPEYAHLCAEAAKCASDLDTYGRIDRRTGKKVYGPHITADSVIIQGDHILMIERGGHPFKGCFAFPGGFVEDDEDVIEAAIRETVEETGLKIPEPVLRRSIIRTEPFSAPFRDPRGRVVTFATFFYLNPPAPSGKDKSALALPRVKGGDDAKRAFWMPISEVVRAKTAFDHFSILQRMLEYLPRES